MPGWVQTKFNDFATDDILPATAVEIGCRRTVNPACPGPCLELHQIYHYPLSSPRRPIPCRWSPPADTVALADNLQFAVGRHWCSTPHDLDTRGHHHPGTTPPGSLRARNRRTNHLRALVVELPGDPRPNGKTSSIRSPQASWAGLVPWPPRGSRPNRGARVASSPSPGKPAPAHPQKAGQGCSRDHARR